MHDSIRQFFVWFHCTVASASHIGTKPDENFTACVESLSSCIWDLLKVHSFSCEREWEGLWLSRAKCLLSVLLHFTYGWHGKEQPENYWGAKVKLQQSCKEASSEKRKSWQQRTLGMTKKMARQNLNTLHMTGIAKMVICYAQWPCYKMSPFQ